MNDVGQTPFVHALADISRQSENKVNHAWSLEDLGDCIEAIRDIVRDKDLVLTNVLVKGSGYLRRVQFIITFDPRTDTPMECNLWLYED